MQAARVYLSPKTEEILQDIFAPPSAQIPPARYSSMFAGILPSVGRGHVDLSYHEGLRVRLQQNMEPLEFIYLSLRFDTHRPLFPETLRLANTWLNQRDLSQIAESFRLLFAIDYKIGRASCRERV